MNYSRNINKTSMGKRLIASWVVIGIIFSLVGFGVGSIVSKGGEHEVKQAETLIYGQYDGRIFTGEMSMDWGQKDLNFIPLDVPMDKGMQEFVFYLSAGYNIDFTFVMALIQTESNFRTDIISETGDYGLMQINEINHEYLSETLGITDFIEPYNNIRAGMFILRKLFEKYESPEKVLMAYSIGEKGASILWEQEIFEINYSKNVLAAQREFNAELERNSNND